MTEETAQKKPFALYVVWGEHVEPDDEINTYKFATEAEREAFIYGATQAEGWLEMEHFNTELEAETRRLEKSEASPWVPSDKRGRELTEHRDFEPEALTHLDTWLDEDEKHEANPTYWEWNSVKTRELCLKLCDQFGELAKHNFALIRHKLKHNLFDSDEDFLSACKAHILNAGFDVYHTETFFEVYSQIED